MITATHKGKMYDVEYSIVNVSELEGELRLDAEYYESYYLRNEEKIKSKEWEFLGSKKVSEMITDGDHGNPSYCDEGIPYLTVKEIEETGINFDSARKVCEEYARTLRKDNYINANEVLLTTVGTIGKACVVTKEIKAILSRDVAKIKLSDSSPVSPFFLQAYLMSINAQTLLEQVSTGGLQQGLYLYQIKQLKVPLFSKNYQHQIENLVLQFYDEKEKSVSLYKQAEDTLLEELGLKDWKPKSKKIIIGGKEFEEEENISIRNLSEVLKVDRLDAEYWEPRYDEIEKVIKKYKDGYGYLQNLIDISKEKIDVRADMLYSYIELADVNSSLGVVEQMTTIMGKELPSRARMKVRKGYVIMSSVEGSIDKIALIDSDEDNLVASTGFFVLKEKSLNKETILVLLKALSKQYLVREAQGTILTAIPYDSLERVILPYVSREVETKIASLVQQSHEARKKSKELLEIAKRAVEIAIEQDEEEALSYIEKELEKLKLWNS